MSRLIAPIALLLWLVAPALAGAEVPDREPAVVATRRPTPPTERLRGLLGVAAILGVCYVLSENRRAISTRTVGLGLVLQVSLGLFLLRVPAGQAALYWAATFVQAVLDCALEGSRFLFGETLVDPGGPAGFVFAFRVLPTVIFVAALFAVLYHLRIMPLIVRSFAWVMARLLGVSGAEALNTAASLFLGQTEAPLTIRPFLPNLTRSELLVVMVSGMGLVSGGVLGAYIGAGARPEDLLAAIAMAAPATIFLSKILVPETAVPETLGTVHGGELMPDANVLDAAARGTRDGLHLALNIAAMLISFIALIALVNAGLKLVGGLFDYEGLSLQTILGALLAPVAWLLGIPWADAPEVGSLLGTRVVLNELIAYGQLGEVKEAIAPRSYAIATIALCGFANISSIGIQLGGIGALMPERRHDLARLSLRALLAATLANFLSASIAGVFL